MMSDIVSTILSPILAIIDKVIPDPAERDKLKIELLKEENQGALDKAKEQLAAILAEEQSTDPWTSRARPSFLYIIYVLILFSLPMGILFAFKPDAANAVVQGFHNWLAAIPDGYLQLFGVGYLGYTGARSFDKFKSNVK